MVRMRIPSRPLALGLASLLFAGFGSADRIDSYVRRSMARNKVPGLTLLVLRQGKPIKSAGYGFAQLENRVPASPATHFEIASITKQFTATAVMMLVQAGKLSVEDPVSKFIPGVPPEWNTMKVRHLLNHSSGLVDFGWDPMKLSSAPMLRYSAEQQTADILRSKLLFKPGDAHSYSSSGYFLLGQIIAKASGLPYEQFIEKNILRPLGMRETRFRDATAVIPHLAQGYTLRDGRPARWTISDLMLSLDGDSYGGLISTAGDLAKWDESLYTDRLLKAKYREAMWSPTKLNNRKNVHSTLSDVGYGWFFFNMGRHKVVHHGGTTGTMIARVPKEHLTVIVLSNLGHGFEPPYGNDEGWDQESFAFDILKMYLG